MTEWLQIVLTSGLTVLAGLVVFVAGQLISTYILDPLSKLRQMIGQVQYVLGFHAQTIHTPISRTPSRSEAAREALLECSNSLNMWLNAIPNYQLIRRVLARSIPEQSKVERAAVDLRALATYMHETGETASDHVGEVNSLVSRIKRDLRIPEHE